MRLYFILFLSSHIEQSQDQQWNRGWFATPAMSIVSNEMVERQREREASSLAFVLQQLAIKSNAVLNSSPVRAIRQWNEIRALLAKHRLSIQCVFEIRSK